MIRTISKTAAVAIALVAGVIIMHLAACTSSREAIYIGADESSVGRRAIELAVEEINAAGGIRGAELKVKFASGAEGQTRVHKAVSIADSLARDPHVIAVIGHDTSLESLPAAHIYNRYGVVQIVPSSSNPLITEIGLWSFRLSADDEQQGAFLAEVARSRLDFGRIAVLFVNNDYGKVLAQTFIDNFEKAGGEIGYTGFYAEGDFESVDLMADQVDQSDLDQVVFLGAYNELKRMIDRFDEIGEEAVILTSDGTFSVNLIDQLLGDIGNCRLFESSFYNPLSDRPEAEHFRSSFREKYGREPETNDALFYDAVKLIAFGVAHAGADRIALRDYLTGLGDKTAPFEGISGKISFSGPEGNRRIVTVFSYNNGFSVFETANVPAQEEER